MGNEVEIRAQGKYFNSYKYIKININKGDLNSRDDYSWQELSDLEL